MGVGHAHIDTAWLWPIRETKRKCARTFANALRLMDDYPDYRFACSQAAQYEWMRDGYPSLFERIQAKAAAGQWLPVGGMWVEADSNLPAASRSSARSSTASASSRSTSACAAPRCGSPTCSATRPRSPRSAPRRAASGSSPRSCRGTRTNRFPHSTFWWEGIDGTRVFTHFPPVDTYNALVDPAEQIAIERNFADTGGATGR